MSTRQKIQLNFTLIGSTLLFAVVALALTSESVETKLSDNEFPYVPRNEEGWLRACAEEKKLKSETDKTKDANTRSIAYDFYLKLTNFRTDLGIELGKGAGCPARNQYLRAASIPGLFRQSILTSNELFGHIERSEKGLVQACAEEAKLKQEVDKIKDPNSLARLISYGTYAAYLELRTQLGEELGLGATCPSRVPAPRKAPVKPVTAGPAAATRKATPALPRQPSRKVPAISEPIKVASNQQQVAAESPAVAAQPAKGTTLGRFLPNMRKQPANVVAPAQVESPSSQEKAELSGELSELKLALNQILGRIQVLEGKVK